MSIKTRKQLLRSLTNRTLILVALIILVVIQYQFITHNKTLALIQDYIPTPDTNSSQCQLSLIESDGWFCEPDSNWKRRKAIHHMQDKRNRISDEQYQFFQNNWEPTLHCAFDRRIGHTGDGGKWICDIHRIQQINDTRPLIYSLGSQDEFSFERAIKEELPNAEIHTFDITAYECPETICTFHQARLGDGKHYGSKSLRTVVNELGHQKREIHILKVDIEGSEFGFFEELFNRSSENQANIPYIRQILFEIHLNTHLTDNPRERTHNLFELFRANNYAIFHKEANLFDPQNVFEYALLRLNPAFFISPS